MSELIIPVKIYRIEMQCPSCGKGMMRSDNTVITTMPEIFPHTCNKCGHKEDYLRPYPYLKAEDLEGVSYC